MRKTMFATMSLVMFGLMFLVGCKEQQLDVPTSENNNSIENLEKNLAGKKAIEITFADFEVENKTLVSKWDAFIAKNNAHIDNFTVETFNQQGQYLYGGGKSFSDNEQNSLSKALSLKDIFSENTFRINELKEKAKKSKLSSDETTLLSTLEEQNKNVPSGLNSNKLRKLIVIIPETSVGEFDALVKESNGTTIDFLDVLRNASLKSSVLQTRDALSWTPDYGSMYTYQYNSSQRDLYNKFTWTSLPFRAGLTYEHDVFLWYDKTSNNGTYLTRDATSLGFPLCSWGSSLPYAYLDTRFLDNAGFEGNKNEIQYTIGSGLATPITNNYSYYTLMRMNNGDANTDFSKLVAQVGSQIPLGCTSTWCSYGYDRKFLVPFPSYSNVPSGYSWSYGPTTNQLI